MARPWPGDTSRTVASVFEEEKPRLLPLPAHPFDADLIRVVRSDKTIYVRFDQNDYSIPPEAVGRSLTLVASPGIVRILDGATELARHRRSYDRLARIEDPNHIEALLNQKQKATGSSDQGSGLQYCNSGLDYYACQNILVTYYPNNGEPPISIGGRGHACNLQFVVVVQRKA